MTLAESTKSRATEKPRPKSPVLRYEADPTWPKPLPEGWTLGRTGVFSITAKDEIVICHRQDLRPEHEIVAGRENELSLR